MAHSKAWSYSALSGFETCARQFYEVRIRKAWPDEKGEAALWGDTVHKAIEARMKDGKPLPAWGTSIEPLIRKLEAARGVTLQVEHKAAINANLQPTDFFAKDVWCRTIADVNAMGPRAMGTFDWKTGKYRDTTDQLKLSAAVNFASFPHIERITIQYVWLKDNRTTTQTFARDQVPAIWSEFMPRVQRMRLAYERNEWPAKPSGLCRKHCPVLSCEFNERRKAAPAPSAIADIPF
jgi:PD-(D/E)XK nuclease superfamily